MPRLRLLLCVMVLCCLTACTNEPLPTEKPLLSSTAMPTPTVTPSPTATPTATPTPILSSDDIPLTGEYFSDENFRGYLSLTIDEDNDGILTLQEREKLIIIKDSDYDPYTQDENDDAEPSGELYTTANKIKILDGLEHFPNLDYVLLCYTQNIEVIKICNTTKLRNIQVNALYTAKECVITNNIGLERMSLQLGACGMIEIDGNDNMVTLSIWADNLPVKVLLENKRLGSLIVEEPLQKTIDMLNEYGALFGIKHLTVSFFNTPMIKNFCLTGLPHLKSLSIDSFRNTIDEVTIHDLSSLTDLTITIQGTSRISQCNELTSLEFGGIGAELELTDCARLKEITVSKQAKKVVLPKSISIQGGSEKLIVEYN